MDPETQSPQQISPNPVQDGKPYFMGSHALIKFSTGEEGLGPETYWLVDKSNHTIRPFESHMALDTAFGDKLQDALTHAITVVPPKIDQNGNITEGVLSDFSILGPEFAIKEDGTAKELHFSQHQLKGRYGKPINHGLENLATEAVDGFLNRLKQHHDKTSMPPSFINDMRDDHQLMAFYISAMAYGDYTLNDIYKDLVRRYHRSEGSK